MKEQPIEYMINRSIRDKMKDVTANDPTVKEFVANGTPVKEVIGKVTAFRWAKYHRSWQLTQGTPYELAKSIFSGFSYCPVFSGRKKTYNFQLSYTMSFDFDHNSVDEVMSIPLVELYGSFVYETPSSTENDPRCRAVFIFDKPIEDRNLFKRVYEALAWSFTEGGYKVDEACKDPLRLYYGAYKKRLEGLWHQLPLENCQCFTDSHERFLEAQAPVLQSKKKISSDMVSDKYLNQLLEKLLAHMRNAQHGEKHLTRRNISRTLGGYIAGGYFDDWAVQKLVDIARSNSTIPHTAEKEILAGIEYGKRQPLYIERTVTRMTNEQRTQRYARR